MRDPGESGRRWAWVVLVYGWAGCGLAHGQPDACRAVEVAIGAFVTGGSNSVHLTRLAPYIRPESLRPLLAGLDGLDGRSQFQALVAAGLSRHAKALVELEQKEPPSERLRSTGHALALLALGRASRTATVASALSQGGVELRRMTAVALGQMRQMRPQAMLTPALEDPDPWVRFYAADALMSAPIRGVRRVLFELVRRGPEAIRARAAKRLLEHRYRFRTEDLRFLPEPQKFLAAAQLSFRGRPNLRSLRLQAMSANATTRALAFALLVAAELDTKEGIRDWFRRLDVQRRKRMTDELTMALALLRDTSAVSALKTMGKNSARAASLVLLAFASSPSVGEWVATDAANSIAVGMEPWIMRGHLEPGLGSEVLSALETLDPSAALRLARVRIAGRKGPMLRFAVEVIGRYGRHQDLPLLLSIGKREDQSLAVEGWRAAARVCAR